MRPSLRWIVLLPLAGCAGAQVQTGATVPGAPPAVRERLVTELTRLGFRRIVEGNGTIDATAGNVAASWATCGPILVGDGDDRHTMVGADQRRGSVRVALSPAEGGTSVSIDAGFVADYRNPNTGAARERGCRSKGTLERVLLDAAAA